MSQLNGNNNFPTFSNMGIAYLDGGAITSNEHFCVINHNENEYDSVTKRPEIYIRGTTITSYGKGCVYNNSYLVMESGTITLSGSSTFNEDEIWAFRTMDLRRITS